MPKEPTREQEAIMELMNLLLTHIEDLHSHMLELYEQQERILDLVDGQQEIIRLVIKGELP